MSNTEQMFLAPEDSSPLAIKNIVAAEPLEVYLHRAKRLESLSKDSELSEYLDVCRILVATQAKLIADNQFESVPVFDVNNAMPLAVQYTGDDQYWIVQLQSLLSELLPLVQPSLATLIRELMQVEPERLTRYGRSLREGKFSEVPANFSLFIWSALALYWSHWAPFVIKRMDQNQVKQQSLCPVCGSHPVASVIRDKPRSGLRYLHCSLCETQWHYVRAQCTNCEQDEDMSLWSFDDYQANIRVESCDACHGYTKMLFVDNSPSMDVVADDLATMLLDQELSTQGYMATTVNPLLLAHETE